MAVHFEICSSCPGMLAEKENSQEKKKTDHLMLGSLGAELDMKILIQVTY